MEARKDDPRYQNIPLEKTFLHRDTWWNLRVAISGFIRFAEYTITLCDTNEQPFKLKALHSTSSPLEAVYSQLRGNSNNNLTADKVVSVVTNLDYRFSEKYMRNNDMYKGTVASDDGGTIPKYKPVWLTVKKARQQLESREKIFEAMDNTILRDDLHGSEWFRNHMDDDSPLYSTVLGMHGHPESLAKTLILQKNNIFHNYCLSCLNTESRAGIMFSIVLSTDEPRLWKALELILHKLLYRLCEMWESFMESLGNLIRKKAPDFDSVARRFERSEEFSAIFLQETQLDTRVQGSMLFRFLVVKSVLQELRAGIVCMLNATLEGKESTQQKDSENPQDINKRLLGWACSSLLKRARNMKHETDCIIGRKIAALDEWNGKCSSTSTLDRGYMYNPPTALEPWTLSVLQVIGKHARFGTLDKQSLVRCAKALICDVDSASLFNEHWSSFTWNHNNFRENTNTRDLLRKELMMKLLNVRAAVTVNRINRNYLSLKKNKKAKMSLRELLKGMVKDNKISKSLSKQVVKSFDGKGPKSITAAATSSTTSNIPPPSGNSSSDISSNSFTLDEMLSEDESEEDDLFPEDSCDNYDDKDEPI